MTLKAVISKIKKFLNIPVSERYREEFDTYINRINLNIGKAMTKLFIVMESILLIFLLALRRGDFFKVPNIYYEGMYLLLIIVMAVLLIKIKKLGKNVKENNKNIKIAMILGTSFILLWCAAISILDQSTNGQIVVYAMAIMALAVFPFFRPKTLLFIYLAVHTMFVFLMPQLQHSNEILFGNVINSTLFLILAWIISRTRYINQIKIFNNGNIIRQKNDELKRLNKELEEANLQLEKLSKIDCLTGICNRYVFDNKIREEWDRSIRTFTPLSLIMVDVDFFKLFNDKYGHQAGDECLKQVALVLSSFARRSPDMVTRYGGEEFAVILPGAGQESAKELAERMRRGVEELNIKHEYSEISDRLTISLGVCTVIPSSKSSTDEFIRSADMALYQAKRMNRNNVVVA